MDRDRLADVGVALISSMGARALSLTSVARHAGVARATAYRMFGGRDALVSAIVTRELELMRGKIVEWGADEDDVVARVQRRVVESLNYLRSHEALSYVLEREPEEIVGALVSVRKSTRPSLIEMVVDATVPDVRPDEAELLYPDVRGGVEFAVRTIYSCMVMPRSSLSDEQIGELVARAVLVSTR